MFEPEHLKRWTMPDSYFGAEWLDYYRSGVGRSRDSDTLEESNFECMLRELGGESETVLVVQESHWAVGWVEWIAIHQDDETALRIADKIKADLADYPVVDESHYSNLEWDRAADFWDSLSPRDKVQQAMWQREWRHWTAKTPVWRFGRMNFHDLANDGSEISESLYEMCHE